MKFSILVLVSCIIIHKICAQLHFASLGSWGTATNTQYAVGNILKERAKEKAFSLVISPGSNFIDGINDLSDTKWSTAFKKPYEGKELNLPFFTVLGTEDWEKNYTAQILNTNLTYSEGTEDLNELIPKWTIPNYWYHYSLHFSDATEASATYKSSDTSVGYVFIDTFVLSETFPYQNITKQHWDSLRATLEASVNVFDWVIVIGDKAILSSGASKGDKYLSDTLRQLLKDYRVDAYISGNDYDMEILEDGSLLHLNCGTGSSADPLVRVKADNSVLYVARPGFCHHVLTKKKFYTEFIDGYSGKIIGNYTKSRNVRDRSWIDRFHLYHDLPLIQYSYIPAWKNLPATEEDIFVRICGTVGILVSIFMIVLTFVSTGNKTMKAAQGHQS